MNKILLGVLLFFLTSAQAAIVDSMLVNGSDPKLLHISNVHHSGYLYAENYQHQKILIYKLSSPYPTESSFSSEQLDDTDILEIMFPCIKNSNNTCTRYLNRRTNKLSQIYVYLLDYNPKKDIIAYYFKDKNLVVISRAFKTCNKPLNYLIKLEENSDFGIKTKFLSTGDLQLDYEASDGKDILKIIRPNYEKLFSICS
ncbi:MAG: hypothetical protein JSR33_10735 [Proteobacteria bacterium]|nr:hypothetical protein [Pseudomonadota bacterium]